MEGAHTGQDASFGIAWQTNFAVSTRAAEDSGKEKDVKLETFFRVGKVMIARLFIISVRNTKCQKLFVGLPRGVPGDYLK